MRNIYRKLTVLSLLASIGSFFLGILPVVLLIDKNPPIFASRAPSPVSGNEPLTLERDERRAQLKALCDWQLYEPKRPQLREAYARVPKGRYIAHEWLGTDPGFTYFYDPAADDIYCLRRDRPGEPLVYGGKGGDRAAERRKVIVFCILLMAVSVTLLHLIQVVRARR